MRSAIRISFILLFISTLVFAGDTISPDSIIGYWMTGEGKGKIQIFKSGNKYFGKIVWLKTPNYEDGTPKVDKNNPKESERKKPLIGKIILRDFIWDGDDDEFDDGYIYDPENGKEYSCYMTFTDRNTLDVRGYIGFSMIGRTQTWTRAK